MGALTTQFLSDFLTLLVAKVASMLQNHAWGESA
jgi:hypothetical protein